MRKSKPVLILLSIQLIFVVALTMINPVTNLVVHTLGTEHTFETSEVLYYGNYDDEMGICCYIEYGFGYNRFDYIYGQPERYAVIDTDENGMSFVSALSHKRPESGDWLGTRKYMYTRYDGFEKTVDAELFKKTFDANPPVFDGDTFKVNPEYKFTVKVHVYKGIAVFDEMYVNGVEIEEFLKNI